MEVWAKVSERKRCVEGESSGLLLFILFHFSKFLFLPQFLV